MIGIEGYVGTKRSVVGIDWLQLSSTALKAAGGAADQPDAQKKADEEKARALEAKRAAEASAARWKFVGGVLLVAAVGGGGYLLLRKKRR